MLDVGGIPQGDYAPVPFLLVSRGWAAWVETDGHGVRFDLGDEVVLSTRARRRPAARPPVHRTRRPPPGCARSCGSTGFPPVLPEWAYGHWKSRDVYSAPDATPRPTTTGYREHDIPLDAIVLDSPVGDAIQHVGVQPAPVPGRARVPDRALRADGVRTVVWVTPWVNLDSREGQYPPDDESAAAAPRARAQLRAASTSCATPTASRSSPSGGWARARPSTSPARPPRRGGASRPSACWRSAWKGIKADDGEGWYFPDDARFADGTHRRAGGVGARAEVPALDAARAGRGASRDGRAVRPPGLDGPAGGRDHLGRRPAVATSGRCGRSSPRRSPPPRRASATGRTTSAATSARS